MYAPSLQLRPLERLIIIHALRHDLRRGLFERVQVPRRASYVVPRELFSSLL